MKKIFNYHTGKLVESLETPKKASLSERMGARPAKKDRLYESAFDDILDSRELHNEKELENIIKNGSDVPILFWYYPGNAIANAVQDICDANDLVCAFVDSRELMSTSIAGLTGVDVIIINELTRCGRPVFEETFNDMVDKANEGIAVIGLCRIDAAYNEMYAGDLGTCDNYIYSPQYDRQSHFVDPEYDDDDEAYESVTEKFAKYRKLYEGNEEEGGDPFADLFDAPAEGGEDSDKEEEPKDEEPKDEEPKDDEGGEGDEEDTEDVPMTAIIITVAKDDAEKCKDEMVDAGIPEDGIEILDGEDDDENAKLRVDADHALELKDYLKGKGIDLEEKIGGEIVDDSEEGEDEEKKDDEEGSEDEDKDKEDKEDKEKEGEGDKDDFDAEFGDLFGDE